MPPFAALGALLLSINCAASVAENTNAAAITSQPVADFRDMTALQCRRIYIAVLAGASTFPTPHCPDEGRRSVGLRSVGCPEGAEVYPEGAEYIQ